jgi:hypothetical protein
METYKQMNVPYLFKKLELKVLPKSLSDQPNHSLTVNERMNEWMKEWMNEWMNEPINSKFRISP